MFFIFDKVVLVFLCSVLERLNVRVEGKECYGIFLIFFIIGGFSFNRFLREIVYFFGIC